MIVMVLVLLCCDDDAKEPARRAVVRVSSCEMLSHALAGRFDSSLRSGAGDR